MADFFALAQSSPKGYTSCMKLVHKMLKKESGWDAIRNYSGFIANGCKSAMHDLDN